MMRRWIFALVLAGMFGCAQAPFGLDKMGGWTTLIDGEKGMENFTRVGEANWRAQDGAIVADKGKRSFLLTKKSYKDFQIRAEFWADHHTNSGIFMRCSDPKNLTDKNCYEANIFDQRSDPTYGTGGITHVGKVQPIHKAGGKWNTYEITAKGPQLTVVFNGEKTVEIQDSKLVQGPFALQFENLPKGPGGAIKWRKVQVKEL